MSFVLPNPSTPQNGQTGDATPILENFQALAQAIASFDGSQVQAKSIIEAALADSINPRLRGLETLANFVYTGCIWSSVSGLNGTMTGGTIYVNGYRTIVSGVGSNTFSASSDTYVYIDYLGNVTYLAVGNNISSPAATANAVLVAIVTANGLAIVSINQGSLLATAPVVASNTLTTADTNGNVIYPRPRQSLLSYRQINAAFTTTTTGSDVTVTGLDVCTINLPQAANIKIKVGGRGFLKSGSAGDALLIKLFDGATQLNEFELNIPGSNYEMLPSIEANATAAAGSHTYKLTVQQATAGTIQVDANGATKFSYIKAELD